MRAACFLRSRVRFFLLFFFSIKYFALFGSGWSSIGSGAATFDLFSSSRCVLVITRLPLIFIFIMVVTFFGLLLFISTINYKQVFIFDFSHVRGTMKNFIPSFIFQRFINFGLVKLKSDVIFRILPFYEF